MMQSWQIPSALMRLDLVFPLSLEIDADAIAREAAKAQEKQSFSRQSGPYHDGRWTRLGLVSPGGDPNRTYAKKGERNEKTEVLKAIPTLERLLDGFEGGIRSAALSRMAPGTQVKWHRDYRQSLDLSYVRLHLPLRTNPGAQLTLGHQTKHMDRGRVWYGDFTFPHKVRNESDDPRLHVMFDVEAGPSLNPLFPESFHRQRRLRHIARSLAVRLFKIHEKTSEEGREALAHRARRDAAIAAGLDPDRGAGASQNPSP